MASVRKAVDTHLDAYITEVREGHFQPVSNWIDVVGFNRSTATLLQYYTVLQSYSDYLTWNSAENYNQILDERPISLAVTLILTAVKNKMRLNDFSTP
jgi:hypothetical protein